MRDTAVNTTQSEQFQELLSDPKESLGVELKQWIDSSSNEGKAKLAKACIALRNNNGGVLVIGVRNDGTPDAENQPDDAQASFHPDVVQGVVSKYASETFEVTVDCVEKDGIEYAVVQVPSGVRTPVACKADLPGDGSLLKSDTVYVRTLHSNNTVSSSPARCKDWERLTQHCFDNREADIGAFIRRHLSGLGLSHLAAALGAQPPQRETKTPLQDALEFLNDGYVRFQTRAAERNVELPEPLGTREASVVIDGEFTPPELTDELLWRLESSKPRHTGWPPWVGLSGGAPDDAQPYVLDAGWEAFIAAAILGPHLDFWRIEPRGRLYHLRWFEDDSGHERTPPPNTTLDFLLQISRTAEIISVALSFAKVFGCDPERTSLAFALRWKGLKGRDLSSWVEPQRVFRSSGRAQQDEVTTSVVVPLETPPTAIAPHVEKLVQPLFALFRGMKFDTHVIENIVRNTMGRRM